MTCLAASLRPAVLAVFAALWAASCQPVQAGEPSQAAHQVAHQVPHPAAPDAAASAPKRRVDKPLRFDPPAAGPAPANADYEACVGQPSPDGASFDCSLLLPRPAAKPRK